MSRHGQLHNDYLIVGAGSAGCIMADRLSGRGARVTMIEAGPDFLDAVPDAVRGPSFLDALGESALQWPNLQAQRTDEQTPRPYVRGRGVGGSSLVNAMVGLWGEVEDYDAWARDHGCAGWSWRDVEPYFRRIEVPLTKADTGSARCVGHALVESCRSLGWELHRGPYPLGSLQRDVGPVMLTRDSRGQRISVADAYVRRARHRSNFSLRANSLVDRVILEGRRARGVVLDDGTEVGADTVVLCAGAIHSPAILLRSGIERIAIGEGLQDHPSVPITVRLRVPSDPGSLAVTALARSSSGEIPADLQFLPMDHLGRESAEFGLVSVALMYVESRGRVRLRSMDPRIDPEIDFALLSRDEDRRRLIIGLAQLRDLLRETPLRNVAEGFYADDRGTPFEDLDFEDGAADTWVRHHTGDYVHAAGTCAMGDPAVESTVVDSLGAVVGYEGLRVCDASVLPRLPRANTHFPVMMVAEAMADRWH